MGFLLVTGGAFVRGARPAGAHTWQLGGVCDFHQCRRACDKTPGAVDYQLCVDRQLAPVADGILGFVGSSFAALIEKQIGLFL